jgi:hypothetical protein
LLIIGNAVKSPRDLPIEFIFHIKSIDADHRLFFVHGCTTQGLRDNNCYVKIDSNSSTSVNLKHLFGDGYLSIEQIAIAMLKQITVSPWSLELISTDLLKMWNSESSIGIASEAYILP